MRTKKRSRNPNKSRSTEINIPLFSKYSTTSLFPSWLAIYNGVDPLMPEN
jgi:hypothetical protein